MKIALNWLKKHIELNHSLEEIEHKLTFAGLEVEHIEEISSVKGGLNGLVIGEVLKCDKIEGTDKLKLTKIKVNAESAPLSIVCGAPNVAAGQKVIVATVGTTLYPEGAEPFQIKKAKIRGVASEGMLCAEDEIGLGKSHDGIIVLPNEAKIGQAASEYYNIDKDTVIEIGLTANRGDAASHLGVARDLSALFNQSLISENLEVNYGTENCPIKVEIESEECPRYSGAYLSNVKVSESPDWLKASLRAIDIEPINNIVDVTNYVMHDLGQPIHAFDADKIEGANIKIRKAKASEKLVTLDDKERELNDSHLVIADSNSVMALAGVFGGKNSGINSATKNIFIESAYFNPVSVRKTAKHFGLNTDASFRYERGTDPELTLAALNKVVTLLKELAGAQSKSNLIDLYPTPIPSFKINLRFKEIKRILGIDIEEAQIENILTHLKIEILSKDKFGIQLSVPSFKSDVTREIDVIEEIIRIYGFENIPLKESTQIFLSDVKESILPKQKSIATRILQGLGFTEIMNNSMIADPNKDDSKVTLTNPLSKETDTMRSSLQQGMLSSIAYNLNRKNENLKFFEFGTTFKKVPNGKMVETPHLSIACQGNMHQESWQYDKIKVDENYIRNISNQLLIALGVDESRVNSFFVDPPYPIPSKKLKEFKISEPIFYTEINLKKLSKLKDEIKVKDIPKFPAVRRDLSVVLNKATSFEEIEKITKKIAGPLLTRINVFDVFEGKPLEEGKKSYSISFTWLDETKTLEDSYIDPIADQLIATFEKQLGALIRR